MLLWDIFAGTHNQERLPREHRMDSMMYNLLLGDSPIGWQGGEVVACEEQDPEAWQNS